MMDGMMVTNQILAHIVKEGKSMLADKKMSREKMPIFINRRTEDINVDSVIHGGYQFEKQNHGQSLQKDQQPVNAPRDLLSSAKSKIEPNKSSKSVINSPSKEKQRSYSFTGFSRKSRTPGSNILKLESKVKHKQSKCIRLQEEDRSGGKVVIDRVVKRESMQEDKWREEKKKALMRQYQEKKLSEFCQGNKRGLHEEKEKKLKLHLSKGKTHKYYFHEGQAVLYQESSSMKKDLAKQPKYNVQADEYQEQMVNNLSQSSHHFKRTNQKTVNEQPSLNQHHRIKSARGEVFASSVLKTINLSRISLNETLKNLEVDQFMKRNDLFNNNHSRQTSSIPYMLAKSGTVYTELSTNQVIGDNKNETEDRHSFSLKSDTTRNPVSGRKRSHFQVYGNQDPSMSNKTEKGGEGRSRLGEESVRVNTRTIRTADASSRRPYLSQKRPRTSVSTGRITATNENLVLALLQ